MNLGFIKNANNVRPPRRIRSPSARQRSTNWSSIANLRNRPTGQPFAIQPVIFEEDQSNNLESGDNTTVITAMLNSGAGPLQGTITATVSGGVARFSNLGDNTAETITLKFTTRSLASPSSKSIVDQPGGRLPGS